MKTPTRPDGRSQNRSIAAIVIGVFVIAVLAIAVWATADPDVEAIDATPAGTSGPPGPGALESERATPAPPAGGTDPDNPVATE